MSLLILFEVTSILTLFNLHVALTSEVDICQKVM